MSKLIEVTDATFDAEVLKSPIPVAVDFYSDQCGPCRILTPILESLAEAIGNKAKIVAVNVAESERLVLEYEITALPTILVFALPRHAVSQTNRFGELQEVRRMVGLAGLGELREALEA